jgi:hypothetical protein
LCLIIQNDKLMIENFIIKIKKHMSLVQFICTKQQSKIVMTYLFSSKMMVMMALDYAIHLKSIS